MRRSGRRLVMDETGESWPRCRLRRWKKLVKLKKKMKIVELPWRRNTQNRKLGAEWNARWVGGWGWLLLPEKRGRWGGGERGLLTYLAHRKEDEPLASRLRSRSSRLVSRPARTTRRKAGGRVDWVVDLRLLESRLW